MSVTDEATKEAIKMLADGTRRGVPVAKKTSKTAISGIVLILRAEKFTAETVYKGIKAAIKTGAMKITGNAEHSTRNINIKELKKRDTVFDIPESMTKEAMKYFDRGCKKYHVKYTAMKDESKSTPEYLVFFRNNDTHLIDYALQEGLRTYDREMKAKKVCEEKRQVKGNEKKPSVIAQLDFFRDRIDKVNEQREGASLEKHKSHKPLTR